MVLIWKNKKLNDYFMIQIFIEYFKEVKFTTIR